MFSLTGQVVSGPPPRPLDVYAHEVREGPFMWSRLQLSKWFDERLGTRAIRVALYIATFRRAARWSSGSYTLGSVLLFFFILQAVTGMMLSNRA